MPASARAVRTVAALLVTPTALAVALSGCTASPRGAAASTAKPTTNAGAPVTLPAPQSPEAVPPPPAPPPATAGARTVPHVDAPWDASLDFGFLRSARTDGRGQLVVTFDRAQWLTGKAYDDHVARHGRPENDYVVVNASHRVRTLRVSAAATLYGNQLLGPGDGLKDRIVSPARIVSRLRALGGAGVPVWLRHVDGPDGPVVYLAEQYLP
jgi:hypothetical protein